MRPLLLALVVPLAVLGPRPAVAVPPHPALARNEKAAHALVRDLSQAVAAGLDRPAPRSARPPAPILVLLAECSDRPHAANQTPEALASAFFGDPPSLRDYYQRASHGRYSPAGETTAWQQLPHTQAFYADGRHGIGGTGPHNARALVEDAVRAADGQLNFAGFDNDGPDGVPASGDDDGMVDALIVVHAGGSSETSGDPDDLLSHTWFTQQTVQTADGVYVWVYSLVAATSPLGVRVHEFGHLLGLPDLYNRSAVSRDAPGGLGDWSLMGTGAWLGDGEQPGDFDGPSKIELGFVDPIVPPANATGLELSAATDVAAPTLYKVWTHGLPEMEYFVLENRRPAGLDAALPGGGMLVYHVDLTRATNDDPEKPRVRLLQADGREDLEGFANAGDAGDPYPGTGSECCRIAADTTPGTLGSDGSETQIEISNISPPTAAMHFDLRVENRAFFQVQNEVLRERSGDGDGVPEAGEELELEIELENLGLAATNVEQVWRTEPVANATWSVDRATFAALGKGEAATATFVLRPAATLADPALVLHGEAQDASGAQQTLSRTVALGTARGFLACLQAVPSRFTRDCPPTEAPWEVEVLQGQGTWILQDSPGDLAQVYRNASSGRYPNATDVALVSPHFTLQAGSELHLLHSYSTQDLDAGWAHDGGRVEISRHGGAWEALEPRGGYPRRLFPESVPQLARAGVFGGSAPRRWDVFPCGNPSGSARIRFRFASDDSIAAAGWEIARVEVHLAAPEPASTDLQLLAEPNPARFPTRVSFRIDASRGEAALPTHLLLFDARGRLVQVLEHAPVPAQSARFTWDGTDRAGHPVPSGVYWARLEWGERKATTRLLVLR